MDIVRRLLSWLGLMRSEEIRGQLNFARSVGKRLDEHREVVEAIYSLTDFFERHPWHAGHMATQDDYLMRLYFIAHGAWPNGLAWLQSTGEVVRPRPPVLGACRLPEYPAADGLLDVEATPLVKAAVHQLVRSAVVFFHDQRGTEGLPGGGTFGISLAWLKAIVGEPSGNGERAWIQGYRALKNVPSPAGVMADDRILVGAAKLSGTVTYMDRVEELLQSTARLLGTAVWIRDISDCDVGASSEEAWVNGTPLFPEPQYELCDIE